MLSHLQKAFRINKNKSIYGSFAEIGAGQEVARFFFRAGRSSNTIAKTMSAYDMIFSDDIYGKEKDGRYVCSSRLIKMLNREFQLLERRLKKSGGSPSRSFFVFANTVATHSHKFLVNLQHHSDTSLVFKSHGWLGVRFQLRPDGPVNQITMHVRMYDPFRLQQQEAIGILGLNLIYAAYFCHQKAEDILDSLIENIKKERFSIHTIQCEGEDLKHLDNTTLNLMLVRYGLCPAVLFGENGKIVHLPDVLYHKNVLVYRSTFCPVTRLNMLILRESEKLFFRQFLQKEECQDCLLLAEITMSSQKGSSYLGISSVKERIQLLSKMGLHTLISDLSLFCDLKDFLRYFSDKEIGIVVGEDFLKSIFDEKFYAHLSGGVLEGLGRLFKDLKTRFYVYDYSFHKASSASSASKDFQPPNNLKSLYDSFMKRKQINDIPFSVPKEFPIIHSSQVHKMILQKDKNWEQMVPLKISREIKLKNLLGFSSH